MQTVDLDEITSKSIRLQLERELTQRLDDFKAYIDQEILHILGK
jgi:DEK C terminal domain